MPDLIGPLQPPDAFRVTQPFTGEGNHEGIDLADADGTALDIGTDVHAAMPGKVSIRNEPTGYGILVDVLDPSGRWLTRYPHLSDTIAGPGDTVTQGQVIARSGNSGASTGGHLHFELRDMTQHLPRGLPLDPAPYIGIPLPTPPKGPLDMYVVYPIKNPDGTDAGLLSAIDGLVRTGNRTVLNPDNTPRTPDLYAEIDKADADRLLAGAGPGGEVLVKVIAEVLP